MYCIWLLLLLAVQSACKFQLSIDMSPTWFLLCQLCDGACRQAADIQDLVREMRDVVQDYCTYFWGELGAVQVARGLTATPHALCSMSLSVHLSAAPHPPSEVTLQSRMRQLRVRMMSAAPGAIVTTLSVGAGCAHAAPYTTVPLSGVAWATCVIKCGISAVSVE